VREADEQAAIVPSRYGQYSVVRELGRGGMARVYEGQHPQLGSRVALKVMEPILAAQPLAAARFLREAKAASQIRHTNVVQVFDVGTQDGIPFIVMEFLDGTDLATLLARKGALPLSGIVEIFLPVISAVETAHRSGIIHRDLKPANLMLTGRGPRSAHPMVLDFGISKIMSEDNEGNLTRSESLLGTAQYMAPELTRGARFATTSSDQYALGVMLYECATGTRPFRGDSTYELMHAVVTAPVVPPSQINPALSPMFDAFVLRAMHRDPSKRFPSVQALGSALLSFGSSADWAIWERELVREEGAERDPWALAGGTRRDDLPAPPRPRFTRSSDHARSLGRAGVAVLFVCAAILTFVASRRPTDLLASGSSAQSPVSSATPSPIVPVAPSPPSASIPTLVETAASSSLPSGPVVARSTPKPTLKTRAASPAGSRTAVEPAVPKPETLLGTNGAPIVE
jgi:serine/threonine-protein kinase